MFLAGYHFDREYNIVLFWARSRSQNKTVMWRNCWTRKSIVSFPMWQKEIQQRIIKYIHWIVCTSGKTERVWSPGRKAQRVYNLLTDVPPILRSTHYSSLFKPSIQNLDELDASFKIILRNFGNHRINGPSDHFCNELYGDRRVGWTLQWGRAAMLLCSWTTWRIRSLW